MPESRSPASSRALRRVMVGLRRDPNGRLQIDSEALAEGRARLLELDGPALIDATRELADFAYFLETEHHSHAASVAVLHLAEAALPALHAAASATPPPSGPKSSPRSANRMARPPAPRPEPPKPASPRGRRRRRVG